jgi:glycosyltransferase involved in cell wall biosynthesis
MRIVTILQYFKSRGFLVDMIHFESPEINGSYLLDNGLVENLYLVSDNPFIERGKRKASKIQELISRKWNNVRYRIGHSLSYSLSSKRVKLPNLMTDSLIKKVDELVIKFDYEAILVTYSYWADIVRPLNHKFPAIRKIIDPTDFLTLQQFYSNPTMSYGQVGNMFGDEIERLSYFDDIIHISYDEMLLFSNFLPNKRHYFVPQYFEKPILNEKNEIKYDVLLIASGNPYNIEGVNWFLKEVYPLLAKNIKIALAGNICSKVTFDAQNITKLGFVDKVQELYEFSLCTICPLKRGSGMKIKVIESLSYGLPVVSTLKGVDGFSNKDFEGGILVTDDPEVFARNLMNLVNNRGYYEKQSAYSRDLFYKYFSSEMNYKKLDKIFLDS